MKSDVFLPLFWTTVRDIIIFVCCERGRTHTFCALNENHSIESIVSNFFAGSVMNLAFPKTLSEQTALLVFGLRLVSRLPELPRRRNEFQSD